MEAEDILVNNFYFVNGCGIMRCHANRVGCKRTDAFALTNKHLNLKVETVAFISPDFSILHHVTPENVRELTPEETATVECEDFEKMLNASREKWEKLLDALDVAEPSKEKSPESELKRVPPEIEAKMRAIVKSGGFEMATTEYIEAYSDEVDTILKALGFSDALVTDESSVWDFQLDAHEIKAASKALGIPINENDRIFALAKLLRNK